jgi:DNA repair protein RadC
MSFLVREIPASERPRERLLKHGVRALSDHELLAIILRTGTKDMSVLDLAKKVLIEFQNLNRLNEATVSELKKIKGIGEAKAIEILAAIELGRRINLPASGKVILANPYQSYVYLKELIQNESQEHLVCVYLNTQSEVIETKTISIGTVNQTIINPKDILKWALKHSATGIIVAHNHPSGNPTPSKEDIIVTRKIVEAAKIMDIIVVDHIIVGKNRYYSFLENKKL